MGCKLTLRNLLRFDAGALEPAERDSLRAAIGQSPNCQRIWRLIGKQSARLEGGSVDLSPKSPGEYLVAAELVAGYLDGTLGKEQTLQLERRALQEPDLLAELILHFRGQLDSNGTQTLPWAVTERLFAMGDSLKKKPVAERQAAGAEGNHKITPSNRKITPPTEAVVLSARLPNVPGPRTVPIQMARSVSQLTGRQTPRRKSHRLGILAATLTSGAAIVGLWFGYGRWFPSQGEARLAQAAGHRESPSALAKTGPAVSAGTAQDNTGPAGRSATEAGAVQRTGAGAAGWAVVSLDEERAADNPGWQVDPAASVFHQFNGHIADCKWLALEGIVALREPGDDLWFGPRSTAQTANGLEWRTLPDSWATAQLGALGELVLDADSAVVVNVSAPENLLALDVVGGRVGLKRLPADLRLRIKHDRMTWEVAILEAGSSLGIDWLGGEPRLAVQSGRVRVGDQLLARSEQLVWRPAASATAGGGNWGERIAGPLPEQMAWLDRPVHQAVVSGTAQAELLASGNVVAEMNRLGQVGAASGQVLAQHLPALLAPEAQLLGVLEGADANSRNEALDWLLSLPPRSPKTRQIWRSISQKSGVPELAPEYFRLVQLVRNSAPVGEPDAEFLTAGLKHQRLFVREMSQALLELRFGNTVQYDAIESDVRLRNQLADRWTKEILAGYQPTAVPKR